jgi:hypothetical protein
VKRLTLKKFDCTIEQTIRNPKIWRLVMPEQHGLLVVPPHVFLEEVKDFQRFYIPRLR